MGRLSNAEKLRRASVAEAAIVAPEPSQAPTKASPESITDYVVGVRKVGPNLYSVVKGRLVDGKPTDFKVDSLAEPLEYSCLTISKILALMIQSGEMP